MRSSFEERLYIVSQSKAGEPICKLSREYGYHPDKILEWVRKYDLYGEDGVCKRSNIKASGALKEELVRQILEKGVPLRQVLVTSLVSRSALESWVSKVRKYGYSALYESKTRGRPKKTPMARPKKRTANRPGETSGRGSPSESRERVAKKSEGLSRRKECPGTSEWAEAIDELRSEYPLDLLLKSRKMARSVFYYHLKRLKSGEKHAEEKDMIKSIFHEHRGRYGYRRVTAEMQNRGYAINHKTVRRLIVIMGLNSKIRSVRYRSYKGEVGKIAPNIINRDFIAQAPNRKWQQMSHR